MAYVVVFAEGAPAQRFSLSGSAVIGRALGCEIWLDDPQLSRRHCILEPGDDGQWLLRDLDSRNGTFLERDQIHTHVLKDGDSIYVGGARIHFHADSRQVASHRPSDPNDASRGVHAESEYQSIDEVNARAPAPRRLPKPPQVPTASAQPVSAKPSRTTPAVPLAFTRAPAKPKVAPGGGHEDPGVSSSWFSAVVSRLRRSAGGDKSGAT